MNLSGNPRDYKIGDTVQDRHSKEVGIIRRLITTTRVIGTAYAVVYLIKKGYEKNINLLDLDIVRKATEYTKGIIDSLNQKEPKQEIVHPSQKQSSKRKDSWASSKIEEGLHVSKRLDLLLKDVDEINAKKIKNRVLREMLLQNKGTSNLTTRIFDIERREFEEGNINISSWLLDSIKRKKQESNLNKSYQRILRTFWLGKEKHPSMATSLRGALDYLRQKDPASSELINNLEYYLTIGIPEAQELLGNNLSSLNPKQELVKKVSTQLSERLDVLNKGIYEDIYGPEGTASLLHIYEKYNNNFGYNNIEDLMQRSTANLALTDAEAAFEIDQSDFGPLHNLTKKEELERMYSQSIFGEYNEFGITKVRGKHKLDHAARRFLLNFENNPQALIGQEFVHTPSKVAFKISKSNFTKYSATITPEIIDLTGAQIVISNPNKLKASDRLLEILKQKSIPLKDIEQKTPTISPEILQEMKMRVGNKTISKDIIIDALGFNKTPYKIFNNKITGNRFITSITDKIGFNFSETELEDLAGMVIEETLTALNDPMERWNAVNMSSLSETGLISQLRSRVNKRVLKRLHEITGNSGLKALSLDEVIKTEEGETSLSNLIGKEDFVDDLLDRISGRTKRRDRATRGSGLIRNWNTKELPLTINNLEDAQSLIDFMGAENFESIEGSPVLKLKSGQQVIYTGKDINFLLGRKSITRAARTPSTASTQVPGAVDSNFFVAEVPSPAVFKDVSTGIRYVDRLETDFEIPITNLLQEANFKSVDPLKHIVSEDPTTLLPVYKYKDKFIGLGVNTPQKHLENLQKAISNDNILLLDIEAYGHKYGELGQVGLIKTGLSHNNTESLVDMTYEGWANQLGVKTMESTKLLPGNNIRGSMVAQIEMIESVAHHLQANPEAVIAAYGESADITKLYSIGNRLVVNLTQQEHELVTKSIVNNEELNFVRNKIKSLRNAVNILKTAERDRFLNIMFLENTVDTSGTFPSLETVLRRLGKRRSTGSHHALEDVELLGEVIRERKQVYQEINAENFIQVKLGDLTPNIVLTSKNRSYDEFGREIVGTDLSGRILRVSGFGKHIDEYTGQPEYITQFTHVVDHTENGYTISPKGEKIVVPNSFAPIVAADIDNLDVIGKVDNIADAKLAIRYQKARNRNLFNRRIEKILKGEIASEKIVPSLGFEDVEDHFRYAFMKQEELNAEKEILRGIGSADTDRKLSWIENVLERDPRIRQQFKEGKNWFNQEYLRYHKRFFDKVRGLITSGTLNRDEASFLIHSRYERLFGEQGEFPLYPTKTFTPPQDFRMAMVSEDPNLQNLRSIRLSRKERTARDLEDFVVRTFYRSHENDKDKMRSVLVKALGESATPNEISYFLSRGKFMEANPFLKNILAQELLTKNINTGKEGIVNLIAKNFGIKEDMDLSKDAVTRLTDHIWSSFFSDQENLIPKGNINSPNVFGGNATAISHLYRLRDRNFGNRRFKETIDKIDEEILGDLGGSFQQQLIQRQRAMISEESPIGRAYRQKVFALTSEKIPYQFRTEENSVIGKTPQQIIESQGDQGYNTLAKLLMRDEETRMSGSRLSNEQRNLIMQRAKTETGYNKETIRQLKSQFMEQNINESSFLNMEQRREIRRVLRWQQTKKALTGVGLGTIEAVEHEGGTVSAENWMVPFKEGTIPLGKLARHMDADTYFGMLESNNLLGSHFLEFGKKYYGVDKKLSHIGGLAGKIVSQINQETKDSLGKGPSAAMSALQVAETAQSNPGGAVNNIMAMTNKTLKGDVDEILKRINSTLNTPLGKFTAIAGAAGFIMASTKIGLNRNRIRDSFPEEESTDDIKMINEISSNKDIHHRIKVGVRGKISADINKEDIVNSVHSLIDAHSSVKAQRTNNINDNRETMNKRKAEKIASRLL